MVAPIDNDVSDVSVVQDKAHALSGDPEEYQPFLDAIGACPRFLLIPGESSRLTDALRRPRLERAVGVIYRPETERQSHYFEARVAAQFDASFIST